MNLNKAFILGNLTRDPELRQTPGGQSVCSFAIATNRFYTDNAGQKQKQAEFHNIVAWGRQAEIVGQYLRKGSSVLVEGRIQTRSWQDPQGAKHWKTEVIAEKIQLPPRGNNSGGGMQEDSGGNAAPAGRMQDETPIIELPNDEEAINMNDIPF